MRNLTFTFDCHLLPTTECLPCTQAGCWIWFAVAKGNISHGENALSFLGSAGTRAATKLPIGHIVQNMWSVISQAFLPPPQNYINTQTVHTAFHLFWMYTAFCFNLEGKGKTFYATNQSTRYRMTSLLILYYLELRCPIAGTTESTEKVQLLVSSNQDVL